MVMYKKILTYYTSLAPAIQYLSELLQCARAYYFLNFIVHPFFEKVVLRIYTKQKLSISAFKMVLDLNGTPRKIARAPELIGIYPERQCQAWRNEQAKAIRERLTGVR